MGDALLEYASGGIATIGDGGELTLDGIHTEAAIRGKTGDNSALASLTENDGDLSLADGAGLALAGSLTNTGALALDATGTGGGRLTVAGMLTAETSPYAGMGVIQIGNAAITEAAAVRVGKLDNTGSIYVTGGEAHASLRVTSATENSGSIFLTNASARFATGFTNNGQIWLEANEGFGGSRLEIAGTLINNGTLVIGGTPAPVVEATSVITVDGLRSNGMIGLFGGPAQARLDVLGAAPATLTGSVNLTGNALLEYAGGGITAIASEATLFLFGAHAFVALADDTHSNSALVGLRRNAGYLEIGDGTLLRTADSLNSTDGLIDVYGGGRLSVGGVLVISGASSPLTIEGGNNIGVRAAAVVDVGQLHNYGSIEVSGYQADGSLVLHGWSSDAGSITIDGGGALTLGGQTLNITGTLTIDGGTVADGTLAGSGEIRTVSGSAGTLSDLTIAAGTTVGAEGTTLTMYGLVVGGALIGDGASALEFGRAGTDDMTNISGFGTIGLADGGANQLTLIDTNLASSGGAITVNNGDSGNIVDASALTSGFAIAVHAGAGADVLKGGAGDDVFYAYGGNQPSGDNTTMTGGMGNNRFVFTAPGPAGTVSNNNTITDFAASAGNQIVFSNSGFALGLSGAGSTPQALPADLFVANATGSFTNGTQRFAYDTGNGDLYYNAAGSGGASGSDHLIAQLAHDPGRSASQLFFIS